MNIIEVKKLNFSYGKCQILNEIDLEIKEKKITGILGPNGCGKSTLLKNILGFFKHTSGEIFIDGKNSSQYTQREKSKIISLVPQKSSLSSLMSVEEFIMLGRIPHLKNTWNGYEKKDRDIAFYYAKELGVEKFWDRKAPTLSGGEFQKVLLARALTQETKVILLDEPTSALDLNHALDLMSKIKKNVMNRELTAVTVLHDLNLASMFCDEIIMLKNGKVFAKGSPQEIINKENLRNVYNLECDIFFTEENIPYIIPKVQGVD